MRPIAVNSAKRIPQFPDLPTIVESGVPDYKYESWFGVMAPAGTPKAIIDKVNQDIAKALQLPDVRARLLEAGSDPHHHHPLQLHAKNKNRHRNQTKPSKRPQPTPTNKPAPRCGSACPITRLIDGKRWRSARSISSTFSCTSDTVSAGIDIGNGN